MKHTQHILMTAFVAPLCMAALMLALFETNLLPCGVLADDSGADFVVSVVMEIMALGVIPLALKLFKLRPVTSRLTTPLALLRFGLLRLGLLCVPMLANLLFYYLFMNVAFGYLAIILALCMAFVYPSMQRCMSEVHE